ncbi:hypothetical protein [Fischerella thermalis]|nr:hypothetical protein [Fischerella thermalis]MBF1990760.1 hypothetical protein [Fischerella thermalis M58_A2018_009]PLZ91699.1 hypothetical protein CI593_06225 [Fischerella thermalis CCMEE 5194]
MSDRTVVSTDFENLHLVIELDLAMALSRCAKLEDIDSSLLVVSSYGYYSTLRVRQVTPRATTLGTPKGAVAP